MEAKKIADIRCPLCGGDIVVTPFGYGCANYDPKDENSCRFSIGKMADKSFTEAQVKQLLNEGITETIRGFKAKAARNLMREWLFQKMKMEKSQDSDLILIMWKQKSKRCAMP